MGNLEKPKQVHFSLDKEKLDRERAALQQRPPQPTEEPKPAAKRKGEKPIKTFAEGRIDFRIFENKKNGRPDWKIEFVRIYTYGENQGEAKSFRLADIADLVRGLYKARRWLHGEEYRRGLRSWWRSW